VSQNLAAPVPGPVALVASTSRFADPSDLVMAANDGDRYTPLVVQITRRYRLSSSDSDDVCQLVWLRVLQYLDRIREPRALPAWIATTAKNESLRVATTDQRTQPVDPLADSRLDCADGGAGLDEALLAGERRDALRRGLAELDPRHRELLLMVCAEPPVSYAEISTRLGIPVGSIGPTRARCLAKLRATASVAALARSTENPT
jgi:RNA polymerase sigma factor (sigma-70 family)